MIYEKLKIVIDLHKKLIEPKYIERGEKVYLNALNYMKNKNLQEINDDDIKNSIVPFFRGWMGMRIVKWDNPEIVHRICEGIKESAQYFNMLRDKNLEMTHLDEEIIDPLKRFLIK